MGDKDHGEAVEEARRALDPLRFLLGSWKGQGTSHGSPVSGSLDVEEALERTFLQARERLYDARGDLDYEDLVFYRYEADSARLGVAHLMSPGYLAHRVVRVLGDGHISLFAGPFSPSVTLRMDGEQLVTEVWLYEVAQPVAVMRYDRA